MDCYDATVPTIRIIHVAHLLMRESADRFKNHVQSLR